MIKAASRVFETSITTGTGALNLAGAIPGFRSFVSAVGSGNKVCYAIDNGIDWEMGIGTPTAGSPDTLSRDTILESSNANAAVNFGGTLNVRLVPLPNIVLQRDSGLNFTDFKGVSGGTGNAHTVTMPISPNAYTDGMIIMYDAPAANTGAATVNVDGLGAKALKVNGADPANGLIGSGKLVIAVYNTANNCFDVISVPPDLSAYATITSLGTAAYEDVETVREIPQRIVTGNTACQLSDRGGHILHPSSDTAAVGWTIPANSAVAFPVNTAITFVNQHGAGTITIACHDTMRMAGSGATGNRTLTANGVATALKITATEWLISGTNLS